MNDRRAVDVGMVMRDAFDAREYDGLRRGRRMQRQPDVMAR
jgi:hypothetical protein